MVSAHRRQRAPDTELVLTLQLIKQQMSKRDACQVEKDRVKNYHRKT